MLEAIAVLVALAAVIAALLGAVSAVMVAAAKPGASDLRALTSANRDETLIDYRACNALISGAKPETSAFGLGNRAKMPAALLEVVSHIGGGLWVGGRAALTTHRLVFDPNALNRKVHSNLEQVVVDLKTVAAVTHRFGLVTSIIDIASAELTFSIRSYGARAFAEKIRAAARNRGATL